MTRHHRHDGVRDALALAAMGSEPDDDDLAELRWSPAVDRAKAVAAVRKAARAAAFARDGGDRGAARQIAREAAHELEAEFGPAQPGPDTWPTDPREAAARIER